MFIIVRSFHFEFLDAHALFDFLVLVSIIGIALRIGVEVVILFQVLNLNAESFERVLQFFFHLFVARVEHVARTLVALFVLVVGFEFVVRAQISQLRQFTDFNGVIACDYRLHSLAVVQYIPFVPSAKLASFGVLPALSK